jgi:hypothetical protein
VGRQRIDTYNFGSVQDGKFDEPDRMFNDIAQTWDSVLKNSTDLKVIPLFPPFSSRMR